VFLRVLCREASDMGESESKPEERINPLTAMEQFAACMLLSNRTAGDWAWYCLVIVMGSVLGLAGRTRCNS